MFLFCLLPSIRRPSPTNGFSTRILNDRAAENRTPGNQTNAMQTTRREFLAGTAAICGGSLIAPFGDRSLSAAEKTSEKQPFLPAGCLDASIQHLGYKDCWAAFQAVGAEVFEAIVDDDLKLPRLFHPTKKYTVANAAGIAEAAADAKAAGLRIGALCMFNRFDERPEVEAALCTKTAQAAKQLGVSAIRIDVVPSKLERDASLKVSIDALRKIMAATEDTGVRFAIENHGHMTNDPAFLNSLFDGVGSARLGLTLDVGNFYWYGHPLSKLYGLYETFAPRVFHTHLKSIRYPADEREKQRPMGWKYQEYRCPIDEGDIDFGRVIAILRNAGYQNGLCVENSNLMNVAPAEAVKILGREIALLKKLRA